MNEKTLDRKLRQVGSPLNPLGVREEAAAEIASAFAALTKERDEALKDVAEFKANNRYQRGYGDGERDERKRSEQRIRAAEATAENLRAYRGCL